MSSDSEGAQWPPEEPQGAEEETQENSLADEHLYKEEIEIIVCEEELKTCRLCLSNKTEVKDIFQDEIEDNVPILVAIIACIHPIEISKDDRLPKWVCSSCLESLTTSFKFRASCLKNDITLKKLYGRVSFEQKRKVEHESFSQLKRRRLEESQRRAERKLHDLLRNIQAENILIYVESDSDKEQERLDRNLGVFRSRVGSWKGTVVNYAFDVKFCIVDEYLFEYRLCKGNLRYLKCASDSCPSVGYQKKLSEGVYTDIVTITKAHNHKKPTKEDIQKQKFFHVMKTKIYHDRTLNMRNVYLEVCEYDPEIRGLVNLKNVVGDICQGLSKAASGINSFQEFYDNIESDKLWNIQFTSDRKQFYQEKFDCGNGRAVVFSNREFVKGITSRFMFVDASFQIETEDSYGYHLITAFVWVDSISNYYPVLFSLANVRSQGLYQKIFEYLHDELAPQLRPSEIVTEYESNLYHGLAETYPDSTLGGSIFYYTQNLYKKVCSLNLSSALESDTSFRNVYHMLLMLPLLPENTISDGLDNVETQAKDLEVHEMAEGLFRHVRREWLGKVKAGLFCVHRMERRIDETVMAPFKKLRDFMMFTTKGKGGSNKGAAAHPNIVTVVEKLMELEGYLSSRQAPSKDFTSAQKKCVLRAWQHIENHPKININHFFTRVITYIKCMENQLWIWGFYRYRGDANDTLIQASDFQFSPEEIAESEKIENANRNTDGIIMEAVIDENGQFMLQDYY